MNFISLCFFGLFVPLFVYLRLCWITFVHLCVLAWCVCICVFLFLFVFSIFMLLSTCLYLCFHVWWSWCKCIHANIYYFLIECTSFLWCFGVYLFKFFFLMSKCVSLFLSQSLFPMYMFVFVCADLCWPVSACAHFCLYLFSFSFYSFSLYF